ncbi:methyl-accepting chemotaxis protein [Methanosphaerula subterraneus]|uniref:methyl-accepting chemotaxis protein n=1 Tax=Methanosphaerula subterraneus TaxID=3350244 RepID=UPI003F857310
MNYFNNKKIRTKLIIAFVIFMLALVVVGAVGFVNMKNINDGMTTLYHDHTVTIEHVGVADTTLFKLRGDLLKYIIIPDGRAQLETDINADIVTIDTEMQAVRSSPLTVEERSTLAEFDKAWLSYQESIKQTLAEVKTGNTTDIVDSIRDGSPLMNLRTAVDTSLGRLSDEANVEAERISTQGSATFTDAVLLILVTVIAAGVVAVLLISVLTSSVATPLERLADVTRKVASGDLRIEIPREERNDEVGVLVDSTRVMLENLRTLDREILEGVNVLASSVSELMTTMAQSASGAQETATSISETTAAVEEVKQTTEVASQKAKNVADNAASASSMVETGRVSVEETIASMNRIQQQMDSIGESIGRLNEQSLAISEIIGVVNDVAEQVNILSVNAAIEAAKAGDQGKGFAVVAQEIRLLAEESKRATGQIRKLLKDTQKAVSTAVMAVEQGSRVVEAGVRQSTETGNSIRVLEEFNEQSAQSATQIAISSKEQLVGMEQVAVSMESIKLASVQNLQGAREAEKVAKNLKDLGLKLKELMNRYQT